MRYQYTAKSGTGDTLTGTLTAASLPEAHRQLREMDLFPVSVKRVGRGSSFWGRWRGWSPGSGISKRDLMTLTSQLAIMARAGVDLSSALRNVAAQCSNPSLKTTLQRVHDDVLSGKSISQALGNYEHVFGQSYIASVAAAEAAGRLPEVLARLADLLRGELRMRSTLRTLLTYPVLLLCVATLVIFALVVFVLPQFADVFEQIDVPVPALTRLLIAVSMEIRGRFWLWGGLTLTAVIALSAFAVSAAGRRCRDGLLLHVTFVRDVTRSLLVGRAFRLLGTMLASGVPLLEGLQLTRSSIRNCFFRELFGKVENEVINGRGMAGTFLASPIVPPAAAQMVATAEQTGTLGAVAQMMGEFYEEEGETRLREFATVLEPVIIIVMGVVVAVIVMSVMLPVFDFATAGR